MKKYLGILSTFFMFFVMVISCSHYENEEIEVTKIEINGKIYFKTQDNVILNIDNYEVVGIYKNGTIDQCIN